MSLEEQINREIKAAMLAKEKVKLEALRAVKSAILLAKTEGEHKETLSAETELRILQKQVKQRRDAAEVYRKNRREELALKEEAEADVIAQYLPKMLSEDELKSELVRIIEELGAGSPSEMGKVMGVATKKLAGKAEGKAIARLVKELLSGKA